MRETVTGKTVGEIKHEVAHFLQRKKDKQYECHYLAARWDISSQRMKRVLEELIADKLIKATFVGERRARKYCFWDGESSPSELVMPNKWKVKEYKQGPEWDTIKAKLAEFRKIKSIG